MLRTLLNKLIPNTAYVYIERIHEYTRRGFPVVEDSNPSYKRTNFIIDYSFFTRWLRWKKKKGFLNPQDLFDIIRSEENNGVEMVYNIDKMPIEKISDRVNLNGSSIKYYIEREALFED